MKIKLAEALLRRKELQNKMNVLGNYKEKDFFEVRAQRRTVSEGIDDIIANVPKMTASQFTREYDWHARQLRLVDAAIQQTNWTTEIEVDDSTMNDYAEPA